MTTDGTRTGRAARWRTRLAVLGCAIALVLAGCAQIPTSGAVGEGARDTGSSGRDAYQIQPVGPVEGQSAGQAVLGFLAAGVGVSEDFAVARQFLAPTVQGRWRPDTVLVYDSASSPRTTVLGKDRIRVDVPVVGRVDAAGRYQQVADGTEQSLDFRLARVSGQWKIVDAPAGIVISAVDFPVVFDAYDVYFFDQSFGALVPEVRWFAHRSAVSTQLARALLAGPSPWLRGAVRTAFPSGTKLAIDAVSVQDGIARVDLDTGVLSTGGEQRRRMAEQLEATLTAADEVRRVQITVQQTALDVPAGASGSALVATGSGGDPVVLDHGSLARLSDGRTSPVSGLPDLSDERLAHPAVARQGGRYAVVARGRDGADDRLLALAPDTDAEVVASGTDLVAPSYDSSGWIWTASANRPGVLTAVRPHGRTVRVTASWLSGRTVLSARVSPDGTRVLVVSGSGDRIRVDVTGVVRSSRGTPTGLSPEALRLEPDMTSVRDVAWLGPDSVVLLGRLPGTAGAAPVVVQVGGESTSLSTVPGAVSVAAGRTVRDILLATQDDVLFSRSGAGWARTARGVADPSFAG